MIYVDTQAYTRLRISQNVVALFTFAFYSDSKQQIPAEVILHSSSLPCQVI